MKVAQVTLSALPSRQDTAPLVAASPQLALVFGDVSLLSNPACLSTLQAALPGVSLVGCSTAGEIAQDGVYNGALVITALHFDRPSFKLATTDLVDMADSFAAGERLAQGLMQDGLRNVLVLGQGVAINGSALIEGMRNILPAGVSLSGGLAGDAGAFQQTWTVSDQAVSPT